MKNERKLKDISGRVLSSDGSPLEGISNIIITNSNERPIDEIERYLSKLLQKCSSYVLEFYKRVIKKL